MSEVLASVYFESIAGKTGLWCSGVCSQVNYIMPVQASDLQQVLAPCTVI